jgi:hypothetical protein
MIPFFKLSKFLPRLDVLEIDLSWPMIRGSLDHYDTLILHSLEKLAKQESAAALHFCVPLIRS